MNGPTTAENATVGLETGCRNATGSGNCSHQLVPGSPGAWMIGSWMLYALICAAGTVGNGLVIYVVLRFVSYLLLLLFHHPSLFHSRLKTFLFCKSFPPQSFLFFFRTDYMDSPDCLPILLSISVFYCLVFRLSTFQLSVPCGSLD